MYLIQVTSFFHLEKHYKERRRFTFSFKKNPDDSVKGSPLDLSPPDPLLNLSYNHPLFKSILQ